jgi:hypothetical protein
VGEDDVKGESDVGVGAVTAGFGVGEDDVTGESDVGVGAVTAGSGAGEEISGVASVHPADSNITSVSGIEIIDSFFILVSPYLSLLDTPHLVSLLYIT